MFPFGKLVNGGDVINTVPTKFSSSLLFLKNRLSSAKFLVDTVSSVSVFPHLPCSPSAPGSGIQLKTADGMNTYGSRCLALQFGSRCFEWSLACNTSMPILGSDFLGHNHLLVDVAGSYLLDSSTLPFHLTQTTAAQISTQLFSLPLRSSVISCPSARMKYPPRVFFTIDPVFLPCLACRCSLKPAGLMQKSWNLQGRILQLWNPRGSSSILAFLGPALYTCWRNLMVPGGLVVITAVSILKPFLTDILNQTLQISQLGFMVPRCLLS